MQTSPRQTRSRWTALAGAGVAAIAVASCDTTGSFQANELFWGFVTISAIDVAGEARTRPNGLFFKGEISSIPNAAIRPDSCFPPRDYVPPVNSFGAVDYLDAGTEVSAKIGTITHALPRQFANGVTSYEFPTGTTLAYTGGDSVVINVSGAPGGYPAAELRGKTAEPFTLTPPVVVNQEALQLRWTTPTDTNTSMIFSLIYTPPGTNQPTREILCAFRDDGIDSIPFGAHQLWASSTNTRRDVVATRLRTVIAGGGDQAIMLISTFAQPLPKE
jgi:hypothetical protein